MRTIKNLALFLLATTFMIGCGKVTYRKTTGGMPYQVYKGKGTQKVFGGNIIKAFITYKVKDSIYFTSFGKMPDYISVNPTAQPYDISEVWTSLKVGDSVIATQMMDTFIKRNPTGMPPEFKKGDRIITTVKVVAVFTSDSAATADREKSEKEWAVSETALLAKYLADKKIAVQKTPSGAFVQITTPGTGNPIDSGKYVSVNYTGTFFSGKKFDSNIDTAFHHVGPYSFTIGAKEMIQGFDEAVGLMKVGGTARVYVPSMLGYGARPNPQSGIKPYENLIFDIEVVDVKDKRPEEKSVQMPNMRTKGNTPQPQK